MRNYLFIAFTVLLAMSCGDNQLQPKVVQHIDVLGTGDILSVPDRFSFSFSLEQRGKQASELNALISKQTSGVITALQNIGVENKSIQSLQVQFNPWVEYNGQSRQQKGFILSRQVTVTLDNLSQYEKAIDTVLSLGVNAINQFSASNSQATALYESALASALNNAKQKASDMAQVLGLKLAGVVSISEQSSGQVTPTLMRSRQFKEADSYQPGEMSTQAKVHVVFALQNDL
jgi:uncharacterized protein YggE